MEPKFTNTTNTKKQSPHSKIINQRLERIRSRVTLSESPLSKSDSTNDDIQDSALQEFITNLKEAFLALKSDDDYDDNTSEELVYIGICKLFEDAKNQIISNESIVDEQ